MDRLLFTMAAFLVAFLFVECHGITAKTYKNLECAGKPAYIAEMKVSPKLNLIYYSLFFLIDVFFVYFVYIYLYVDINILLLTLPTYFVIISVKAVCYCAIGHG